MERIMNRQGGTLVSALVCLLALASAASAHTTAASHLTLEPESRHLTIDLSIPDVAQLVPVQVHVDGTLRWGPLQTSAALLVPMLQRHVSLARGGNRCTLEQGALGTAMRNYAAGPHLSIRFNYDCGTAADDYTLAFTLFREVDPTHRALVTLTQMETASVGVITIDNPQLSFSGTQGLPPVEMLVEGVHHILSGFDHLLFLMLLVLPAIAATGLRQRLLHLGGIVTAFTAAHSVTLALAATGVVALPAGPVEIAIAASIVVAGLVNVLRPGHRIGWKLAAGFGLLHGFGFAGALREIGLGGEALAWQLLAFNAGVELGQLAVVALALPLLVLLATWRRYRDVLVPVLSAAGAGMGVLWVAARL